MSHAAMIVRSYQHTDQADVSDLILSIQQQEFGINITAEDQPDLQHIDTFYQRGAGQFWVAEELGQIIGTIALIDIGGEAVALRKMFVAAAHRGAVKGVAQTLLQTCHAWAATQGIKDIYLGTIDVYHAARRFYEKHGYVRINRVALPPSFPLIAVDNVFYHRKLA